MWLIQNKHSGNRPFDQIFFEEKEASKWISAMGPVLANEWKAVFDCGDQKINRIINEGLEKNDLEGIILPRVSVDEYLPSDTDSDNIVIAFFIKGVPEAVVPFKDFCEKCNGVLDTDYGDSDTIISTSIVYLEFDRENMDIKDIRDMMVQVSMLSGIEIGDFTITLPHTNEKFPFSLGLMKKYFDSRTKRDNKIAMIKAQKKAEKERQSDAEQIKSLRQEQQPEQQEATESVVDVLVDLMLTE